MSKAGKIDVYDCPEKFNGRKCNGLRYHLSSFDKRVGTKNGFPVYERTLKFKCNREHTTTTTKPIPAEKYSIA